MTGVVDVVPRAQYESFIATAPRAPASSRSARRSTRASARSATGSTTSTSARRSAATRCSPTRRGSRTLLRNGDGQMPAVGKNWTDAQIDALVSYTKTLREGERLMAVNVDAAAPYRADWRRGKIVSWLTTVDHKRIGILYIWTSLVFFAARRHPRPADARAARDARTRRS